MWIVVHTTILVFGSSSNDSLLPLSCWSYGEEDPEPDWKRLFGYVSIFSCTCFIYLYSFKLWHRNSVLFSLSFYLYICPQKNYFRCKGTLTCQKCLFFFSLLLYIYTGISLNTNLINFSEVFWSNFCRIFKKLKLQIYFNIMLEDNKEFRVNYMHVYALKIIMSLHSFHSNEHKIFTI